MHVIIARKSYAICAFTYVLCIFSVCLSFDKIQIEV